MAVCAPRRARRAQVPAGGIPQEDKKAPGRQAAGALKKAVTAHDFLHGAWLRACSPIHSAAWFYRHVRAHTLPRPQEIVRAANWRERVRRATNCTNWVLQGLVKTPELAVRVAKYEVRRVGDSRWLEHAHAHKFS